ncbi:SulP family inorganic anion transporter [Actinotalea sp. M2MS4P-6]|uniref:SulP family inorganic anion transporter n=1 Tax=Actinotalea sp. M2MS4P-6 TaxID=2983762 RepID=UPI0021E4FBD5|nr:SulP family inorganic anion transporter [Actinotalea sp. M2MS4P-6]MCV2394727.1 SulP family inorganic anion transporter [Actinotalea sp. M2MS4P-6]
MPSGLGRDTVVSGAVAGFATGLFSIPEGMAYAQLAGVNPLYGLYSGLVATLVAALATGTVLMISTLTSAIALSTGSVLVVAGIANDAMPGALFTVTLLSGVFMLVLGLLKLGSLVSFVSNSVMTGFVAAASLLILIGELGDFSGYDPQGSNKLSQLWDWFAHIGSWDPATTGVALATVALVVAGKAFRPTEKLAPVIALVIMTVAVPLLGLASVATVGDIASIPNGLPTPDLPDLSSIPVLVLGSVSVALVALVQGAGISTAYPNPDGSKASASRDFVGQGLGNVAGAFFQSMATGGSLSRTGISVSGGSQSRWGGVFSAAWLGLLVLLFGSVAETVPLAVIAGLLFVIAVELVVGRLANARLSAVGSPWSFAAMLLTFGSAMFIPLQWTIFLGAGLSILVFVGGSARAGKVNELVRDGGYWTERPGRVQLDPAEVTVVGLRDWQFFAEIPRLAEALPRPESASGAVLVLRIRDVDDVRSTGLRFLDQYCTRLTAEGNTLVLAGVAPLVAEKLARSGLDRKIGEQHIFLAKDGITASLDEAYDHARRIAGGDRPEPGTASSSPE